MTNSKREKPRRGADSEPGEISPAGKASFSEDRDASSDAFYPLYPSSSREASSARKQPLWICLALAILVIVPYAQVAWGEFLLCDDNDYITTVAPVKAGLTWEGVKWAFTAPHASNWHPLTWLSHMLDCELFGLNPGPHHLVSVAFHMASTIILFLTVRMMTGAMWRSAAVAALFALHPLRAESVAWVAERKDVLSGFFWMLTLLSYAWYARRPGIWRYLTVFLNLALGLLCKSMAVTMPFLLLLLDVWPLRRAGIAGLGTTGLRGAVPCPSQSWGRLVLEKLPLLALAFVISKVAIAAQGGYGSITGTEDLTMTMRVANALVTYAAYLWDMVCPINLGLFYPHPASVSQSLVEDLYVPAVVAGLILLGLTVFAIWQRKKRPWLLIGWLWYLGTLVPVIGIVQIGAQARADRYTYLTMIGITIGIVWSVGELVFRREGARTAVRWVAVGLGVECMVLTWMQVSYWRTDFTLFERSIAVIPKNYFAYNQLGAAYREKHDPAKAEFNFAESLKFNPDYDFGNNNLGVSLMERNALDPARKAFEHAVKVNAQFVAPLRNLALLLAATGHPKEAAMYCERAVTLQPGNASAQAQLAAIYEQVGQAAQTEDERSKFFMAAEERFKFSLSLDPFDTRAMRFFGIFYANRGRLKDAADWLNRTVQLDPNDPDAWNALGVVLAQQGDKAKGIACIEKALMIAPQHPQARGNLNALRAQP